MAAHKKRRRARHNRSRRRSYRHRRSNPVMHYRVRRRRSRHNPVVRHRRHRRNPAGGGIGTGVGSYVTFSLWAIAGMIGSRALPQAILGASNSGMVGYGANLATALIGGPLLGKVLKNRRAGVGFTVGGILSVVARALQEYTPFGTQISQAFSLQGVGDWGMAGLGEYLTNNQFAQPQQMQNTDWPAQVPSSTFVRAALPPPVVARGMAGLGAETRYSGSSIWG